MNHRCFLKFTCTAGILALAGCDNNPFEHDGTDTVYRFAAENLDTFFIYRDRMPERLYSFETPEALYRSVNDQYTEFFSKEKALLLLSQLSTNRSGVGIVVDSVTNGYLITEVLPGSPGERDGLQALDTIVQVGDVTVAGMTFDEFLPLLQGEDRVDMVVRIKRGVDFIDINVIPCQFRLPTISIDSINASVVVITIKGFHAPTSTPGGTADEFSMALEKTAWAEYTVLDLRSNTGGLVLQCIEVASQLVPRNTPIITVRYRGIDTTGLPGEFEETYKAFWPGSVVDRKLYVLVDSLTASASEILLSCLMQREGVTVIGDTTFGKWCAQILLDDGNDSVIAKITYMTTYPVGENTGSYKKVGIVPDVLSGTADALDVALQMIGESLPAKRRVGGPAGGYRRGKCDVSAYSETPTALFTRADMLWLNRLQ